MKYCDTPRGAAAVAQANVMLRRFARWAQADAWLTDPHQTPEIDALFARGGVVRAFAEAKTRPTLTLHGLHEFQSLLISANKIQALVDVTSLLYGVGLVVVGLEDAGVYWTVCRDGVRSQSMPPEPRRTQANIYGGEKVDHVVYLPTSTMRIWSQTCPFRSDQ